MRGKIVLRDGAQIVSHHQRNIVSRWTQRAIALELIDGRSSLHFQEIVGSLPLLLTSLVAAMRSAEPGDAFRQGGDGWSKARTHAQLRLNQGFTLASLLREFQLLRNEIWHAFRTDLPEIHTSPLDMMLLGQEADYVIDAMQAAVILAWWELEEPEGRAVGKEDNRSR